MDVGGIGVGLDLSSGRAIHAIWRDRAIARHPDTQEPLSAVRVPCWDEILRIAVRSFDAVPLGYCGIDIVVDVRHGPAILELNARPGLSIQLANRQGLRPLLEALPTQPWAALAVDARVALGQALARRA